MGMNLHADLCSTSDFMLYRYPSRKFLKAVKRVRAVNQKLIAFERGFISEDGIKDREWYRHLAVAPGKWLGEASVLFHRVTHAHS
jgi:N-acetylated-alpha-linked acidic dipeptidase